MSTVTPTLATIDDLYREEGKAELIRGRIVRQMPTGYFPTRVASRIFRALDDWASTTNRGEAFPDNLGYVVPELSSGRESFCPDASFYVGPLPKDRMRFILGPPTLAVEVRSENDYDAQAERAIVAKRADYFEAGTLVVWDVDPIREEIRVYRAAQPDTPVVYRRGESAEAEPAVPNWRVLVDVLFTAS
jgi:Uma2 family endonuclease